MNIIRIIIQLHVEHQNGSKPFNNEFPRYYTATSLRYTEHFFVTLGFSFCSTKKKKKNVIHFWVLLECFLANVLTVLLQPF